MRRAHSIPRISVYRQLVDHTLLCMSARMCENLTILQQYTLQYYSAVQEYYDEECFRNIDCNCGLPLHIDKKNIELLTISTVKTMGTMGQRIFPF